jgi:3-methyladenine DNA glycosylase AlkD
MKKQIGKDAIRDMRRLANPTKARLLTGFFKTGPGQYGEGDKFLGVMVPQTRAIAREYSELSYLELKRLMRSSWHEERLLALIILVQRVMKNPTEVERKRVFEFYVAHMPWINNWDLVDLSAPQVVGGYLWDHPKAVLWKWSVSSRLWDRRVAVLATFAFIRKGRFDENLRLAEKLMRDPEDLMHKAVGWMLREVGKRDEKVLLLFLDKNAGRMPRTMLRYSIERLTEFQKQRYMQIKRISV